MAQSNCISLQGSTACPAFNQSSISTDSQLTGLFPFLSFVSDAQTFDTRLRQYIVTQFSQQRFQQLIGCNKVDLSNTTDLYARYTTSVLCNAIIQNSVQACGLNDSQSRPLCADSCAENAISEQQIASSPDICGTPGNDAINQIRADFTNCALPANSLSGSCIEAVQNEPDNCGYSSNLGGLCGYCAASSPNATDSCCVNSQAESRCSNVHLPRTTSMPPLFTTSSSSHAPSSTGAAAGSSSGGSSGLSGGAIAGIVVGSVLGALLLLGLIVGACILMRRRRDSQQGSIFNQPSPSRPGPPMSYTGIQRAPEVTPGGRVTRMSALEATSSSEPHSSPIAGAYNGSSDEYNDSPESQRSIGMAVMQKRDGSLSSHSHANNDSSSPGNDFSSPEGVASGQSEQLQFFKDYYSQDEIRPNDIVATLWAYQPRANDEFELERGDMLKVVGIWDDGWATGVRVKEKAEEWEARRKENRDSGVSNGSKGPAVRPSSPQATEGDIKAFPLVCVCLPQHWRKTIEGDSTTEAATSTTAAAPPSGSP
ncbi:hypothetical protein NA57DRAFT_80013 [Rhizodiscina lignyota]|uniref:SH3 domain-containing protein n=1 Tax=Rhizodiscina lignyota TaxID=1504668 RepID=A0A9P4I6K8_9PEZI|nr:hypothetical protein NA57DRAFT_80013 [Rhizodiscina lignyota]